MNISSQKSSNSSRELAYYLAIAGSLALLAIAASFLTHHLIMAGWNIKPMFMYPANLIIIWCSSAKAIASGVCKLAGVSAAREEIEKLGPFNSSTEGGHFPEEIAFYRGSQAYILPICCTGLTYCFFTFLLECPHPLNVAFRIPLIAVTAAVGIVCWKNLRKPAVKIDTANISSCDALGIVHQSVQWSKVASGESIKNYDTLGRVISQSIVFRNKAGKKVLKLSASSIGNFKQENWEQVLNFVRTKQTASVAPIS